MECWDVSISKCFTKLKWNPLIVSMTKNAKNGPKMNFSGLCFSIFGPSSSLCCRCHGKWGTGSTESRGLTGNLMSAILECFGFHLLWFCLPRCVVNYWRLACQRPPLFRLLKTTIPPSGDGWTQVSNRVVASNFWTFDIPLYWWYSLWYSSVTPVKISLA